VKNNKFQVRRIWSEIRWFVIGLIWLLSLILGYSGFSKYASENRLTFSITERIYRSFQLISMNSGAVEGINNWMLEIARFLLPALTAYTALQAITHLFREQMQWFHLWRLKDHIIICGLGRKGTRLVDDLLSEDYRLLVIQNNLEPVTANEYRSQGVIIMEADATNIDTLNSARLSKASHLVCFLGEDQQNLNIAHHAFHIVRNNNNHPLTCIIHLTSQDLLNLVKRSELNLTMDDPFIMETFNIYDRISHQLIQNDPDWEHEGKEPISTILILGLGRLGQNICKQAGYTWFTTGRKGKLNVIVIDQDAAVKIEKIIQENQQLRTVCNFTAIKADLSANYQIKTLLKRISDQQDIQRAYVCLGNPILSLQVGLTMGQIPERFNGLIYVRIEKDSGLAGIIENPISGLENPNNLIPFDIYQETCSGALVLGGTHELLAIKLNENYQLSLTNAGSIKSIKNWENLPKQEKIANRKQADRVHTLLKSFGYQINPLQDWEAKNFSFPADELLDMAQKEHELWCRWKRENGWQFGEKRDNDQKIHPDLKPWESLSNIEQEKNISFIRNIPRLLAELGFQIEKRTTIDNKK